MHDMCGPYPLSFSNQLKLLPKLVFKAHQKCLSSRSIQLVLFPRCGKRCFDRCIYSVLSPISTHSVKALPTLLINLPPSQYKYELPLSKLFLRSATTTGSAV